MGIIADLSDKKFGKLTVIEKAEIKPKPKNRHTYWRCICDCGKESVVSSDKLKSGETKSCGCLLDESRIKTIRKYNEKYNKKGFGTKRTHGQSGTRLYNIYQHMIERCYKDSTRGYKNYGGRGICVCDEWRNGFSAFYEWAIKSGYKDNLTIDRIDVNGDYSPENCRWSTKKTQANNKRNNVRIEYNGKSVTLSELSEIVGVGIGTIWWRYHHGRTFEEMALPVKKKGDKI